MAGFQRQTVRSLVAGVSLAALAGCAGGFDFDLRGPGAGGTSAAAQQGTGQRPDPDSRGVISYPNFQVAVARRGDTVSDVAGRVGLPPEELARFNGIPVETQLRSDEVLALPTRVAEPAPGTGSGMQPVRQPDRIDVASLAGDALDRAERQRPAVPFAVETPNAGPQTGPEPLQHQVVRGETAYSIARLYGVSPRALADWNGLGTDLAVREGQFLLIPVAAEPAAPRASETAALSAGTSLPGSGSPTPVPPSATTPLPAQNVQPAATMPKPPSPQLAETRTDASRLLMPVEGGIIRGYEKGKNDGIDIAAAPGTKVRAADDGTVAAITRDTDQVPILVVRHDGGLLTVYANIDGIEVEKGDKVKRGETLAEVRKGPTGFVHFEVREGFESADPVKYVN